MRRSREEEQLRMLIRETILHEGIWDSIKSGVGKIYDYIAGAADFKEPSSGIMKKLDDFAPDEEPAEREMPPLTRDLSGTASLIADAYPKMAGYADEIVRVAADLGTKAEWLANVINFESRGGDPQAVNPVSGATGLIQFMPKTAQNLGTSTDALYNMDAREQMQYVEEYFAPYRGNLNSQEDVYMAVFYPKAMGNPDFEFSDRVIAQNPGIRTPRDYVAKANSRARLT